MMKYFNSHHNLGQQGFLSGWQCFSPNISLSLRNIKTSFIIYITINIMHILFSIIFLIKKQIQPTITVNSNGLSNALHIVTLLF